MYTNNSNLGNGRTDVLVIENSFVDITAIGVEESDLAELGLVKGTSTMMTGKAILMAQILSKYELKISPGGAGANVVTHAANGGVKAAFMGTVGDDAHGRFVKTTFSNDKVVAHVETKPGYTGACHCLVTADGQRTMSFDPGNALNYSISDLKIDVIKNSRYMHTSLYALTVEPQRSAVLHAMDVAARSGVLVCFDLANSSAVAANREFVLRILNEYVDIAVANEDEAIALFGSVEAALHGMSQLCEIAIVKLGGKGSIIIHNGQTHIIPPFPADVVDTTGAGDAFIGTFVACLAKGMSIDAAGREASRVAAIIVGRIGAR